MTAHGTRRRALAFLAGAVALPASGAGSAFAQQAAPLVAAGPALLDVAGAEAELVGLINTLREARGLDPMSNDAALAELARERSADMAARAYFSHDIPGVGAATEWALAELPDARETAENLGRSNAANDSVIGALFNAWVASPGHLGNMLSPRLNRVGIGVAETGGPGETTTKVVTQLFAASDVPLARAGVAGVLPNQ